MQRAATLSLSMMTSHTTRVPIASFVATRPPGREVSGDIFYIHSRMLERATHLATPCTAARSPYCRMIIETERRTSRRTFRIGRISFRSPTARIYLSPTLFELRFLPRCRCRQSVSRVAARFHWRLYRAVAGDLKLAYAPRSWNPCCSAPVDDHTQKVIDHGQRIRVVPDSSRSLEPASVPEQIVLLLATDRFAGRRARSTRCGMPNKL